LKHASFDRVYREGRRIFSPNLTVFYRFRGPGELEGAPRVGFTVGRVLGGAVQRNRIRRRLREAARMNLPRIAAPVDIVMNPKKSVLKAEFALVRGEVESAFTQILQRAQLVRDIAPDASRVASGMKRNYEVHS
jgi:ribonuclease P protein component